MKVFLIAFNLCRDIFHHNEHNIFHKVVSFIMENNKKQQPQSNYSQEGAGSTYHKNHAGHLPDYGGNDIDPNAKGPKQKG